MAHKKRIYLISPPIISDTASFIATVSSLLDIYHEHIFAIQLRVKGAKDQWLFNLGLKIGALCNQHNVFFIINDNLQVAQALYQHKKCDGLHVGQQDKQTSFCRTLLPKPAIIGVSCYDQLALAEQSIAEGASYVSFGAFFPSKTKLDTVAQPKITILHQWQQSNTVPAVAIGGINDTNCSVFLNIPDIIIAMCNYIWHHKDSPAQAMHNILVQNVLC